MTNASPQAPGPHAPGGNPFWDFSLAIYASPAVQRACLELQDGAGVDVNVLLYMLWLGVQGRRLSDDDVTGVLAAVDPWRVDVVVPLRAARRSLKTPPAAVEPGGAEALRALVKKVELEAERLQQAALFRYRQPEAIGDVSSSPGAAATANVAGYGRALGQELAAGPVGVMLAAVEAHRAGRGGA